MSRVFAAPCAQRRYMSALMSAAALAYAAWLSIRFYFISPRRHACCHAELLIFAARCFDAAAVADALPLRAI